MEVRYSNTFKKGYKKLPSNIKTTLKNRLETFHIDPFSPSLKTHKLSGKLKGFYSLSITYSYRLVFTIESANIYTLHFIGTHDIYK